MTNLSDLSQKRKNKLIIIHGLNNNPSSFLPLMDHFKHLDWGPHFLTLPCHGANRKEARNFKEAFACFDRSMRELTTDPYSVIAFSQGALYLQLWLEKRPDLRPKAQVLLAPALTIHRHRFIEFMTQILPSFLPIKSFSPKTIRRYQTLSISEYRILIEGLDSYQRLKKDFRLPTLIMIDPKDELVNAQELQHRWDEKKSENCRFELFPREYLNKGLGCHHIIFHPEYFSTEDWKRFTLTIDAFLKKDR